MASCQRLCLVALVTLGVSAEWCGNADCSSPLASSLMQRRARAEDALAAMGIKTAEVNPKGTIDMLLNEMNAFISNKGDTGIDPDEIEHIHGIKAMIDNTILPTILEEVEDDRKELELLYQDIVACHDHAHELDNITRDKLEESKDFSSSFKVCAEQEEEVVIQKEEVCTTLNRTRVMIRLPGEEDFPPPNVPDEEMLKYLHMMDEFFCGTYETFEEEWKNCTELESNYTNLHQQCMQYQKEWEETTCSYKATVRTQCETYETCWTDAVKKYNQRKQEIMELHVSRAGEYEGATKIECLWSAWVYEGQPCTVNKTRIQECHEYAPNYTNVTIEYPYPPAPPHCDVHNVEVDVCSDDWFSEELHAIGLSADHLAEIRSHCMPCPTMIVTEAPQHVQTLNLMNMEHVSGDIYMKTGGQTECDATIESIESNVYGITVVPEDPNGRLTVEIKIDAGSTYTMDMENRLCTVDIDAFLYDDGDRIGCTLTAGQIVFTKNGQAQTSQADVPEGAISGLAKVTICSAKGTTIEVKFDLLE